MRRSSWVFSRITDWARPLSFHRLGSFAASVSSSRRFSDVSQSKMPPQQPERLLDGLDRRLDFGAHANSPDSTTRANLAARDPMSIQAAGDGMRRRRGAGCGRGAGADIIIVAAAGLGAGLEG